MNPVEAAEWFYKNAKKTIQLDYLELLTSEHELLWSIIEKNLSSKARALPEFWAALGIINRHRIRQKLKPWNVI